MKDQQKNHNFTKINAQDIYCLRGEWVDVPFDSSVVLTSLLRPPPPANVTVKYNNTLQQNNFESVSSSNTAVPTRPFWIVVGFCCYIFLYVICDSSIRNRVSKLKRYKKMQIRGAECRFNV